MKIKTYIWISSIITTLLSVLFIFFTTDIVINLVWSVYSENKPEPASSAVFSANAVLAEYDMSSGNWQALDQRLQEHGYSLFVFNEQDSLYLAVDEDDYNISFMQSVNWPTTGFGLITRYNATAVGQQYENYTVVAINTDAQHKNALAMWEQYRGMLQVIAVLIVALVLAVVLLVTLHTQRLVKRIMRPVNALSDSATRVEHGDLSKPVDYYSKDEFSPVCTAFNQMQIHLQEEQVKNAAYEQSRIELIAGISHDLRTPLTSIKGYLKGLQDGVADTEEKRAQYQTIAYRKACEMDSLLQKLFFLSRLETRSLPLLLVNTDLLEFVKRFAATIPLDFTQTQVAVTIEGDEPCRVRIDQEQMHRVLANLTQNSVRYAQRDPLLLHIRVYRENEQVFLQFSDNGPGVTDEQLPHIFEQFWRADAARNTRNSESSGLGLHIVKQIVDAHAGTVTAAVNDGLQITIELPAAKGEANV